MKSLRLLISLALLVFSSLGLRAAELFWDPNATIGTALGGAGNWDQEDPFWYNGTIDVPWTNADSDDANFTGNAGTVVLTENITAGNLFFTNVTGNYYLTNATGAETLTLSAGTVDTGSGEHTIAGPVNAGTMNKNGAGRLHLFGNNNLGTVMVNQGELSLDNINAGGSSGNITVVNGAALELNGGASSLLNGVTTTVTISGSGITNSGALRNKSGTTTFYGQIFLGANNTVIYSDSGTALLYDAENGPMTDNGNGYNLIVDASGTGNFHMGATQIGGSLTVNGPAACYAWLNGLTSQWTNTYVGPGATFFIENSNSVGSPVPPSIPMETTNLIVDGATVISGGTYTWYTNAGITVTANGGTFTNTGAMGTWTTGSIYSPSNGSVSFGSSGSAIIQIAGATISSVVNIGSGSVTLNGGNPKLQSTVANVFSNLVINGATFTFNYDASGGVGNLGTVPNAVTVSNIFLNGGQVHVGHSTTIAANRGIYVTSAGTTIEDVTGGGTVTINGPISGPGSVSFPLGKSGSTTGVILAGNNTYTGTTTISGSSIVTVGNGGSTGTLGTGNTPNSGVLIFNRTGTYTYGGIISGTGPVSKSSAGVVTLTGINTYTGITTNNAGSLLINGTNSGPATIYNYSGATLGGTGVIKGIVTNNAGGTIYLGLGTLSVSNNVSNSGNVAVLLNKSLTQSNGMLAVLASASIINTNNDTLLVTNVGPALAVGDTFQVFSKALTGSGTMTISGGGGVTWNNNLAVNGSISVATLPAPPKPVVNQTYTLGGTNFVFGISNLSASATYNVLATTNLLTPLTNWTYISTNTYSGNGQYFITNPINPTMPQLFYTLEAH
ncbi:MAG TPA: hypothetical protein VK742_16420 [Candidatus Sulfotelmatobacter sp.]|jgi:fibronectin-binding autotransporter adhesin|nr:hypothetical protein [Candidatus Sulfotelmatobacter sp.]